MPFKLPAKVVHLWRWLEGIHTIEWLYSLAPSVAVGAVGLFTGVQLYWILLGIPLMAAALLFLGEKIFGKIGFMPLSEAARVAFEELPDTIWRVAATRWEDTPEGRLDWVATRLSLDIPIYGRVPPSQRLELIPKQEIRSGSISEGATSLQHWGDAVPSYVDLAIKRRDLRPLIDAMQESEPTKRKE